MDISASTRRGAVAALLGIGLAGFGPLLHPARAALDTGLRLPDRPLRLTRVLERGLGGSDGNAIIVRRWWEVLFARQGRGIIVSGRQIGAEVDAPPKLAQLARIEQQRDESAMFPLMLSESGAIVSPPAVEGESDAVTAALRVAGKMIDRAPLPADERARISHYLTEVHRAGSGLLNTLPGDLLYPAGRPVSRQETVALPDGLTGQFALTYVGVAQPDAPWLARAERKVVTRIGAMQRNAAEIWTLDPA